MRRAARLTESPITAYSRRAAAPTSPQYTAPVLMPARNGPPGKPEQLQAAADRSLLVVLVADRRAEEGHEHVARRRRWPRAGSGRRSARSGVRRRPGSAAGRRPPLDRRRCTFGRPDEDGGDLPVLVHQLPPPRPQPLGDGGMEEGGQPSCHRPRPGAGARPAAPERPAVEVRSPATSGRHAPRRHRRSRSRRRPASTTTSSPRAWCSAATARWSAGPTSTYPSRTAGSPMTVCSSGPAAEADLHREPEGLSPG